MAPVGRLAVDEALEESSRAREVTERSQDACLDVYGIACRMCHLSARSPFPATPEQRLRALRLPFEGHCVRLGQVEEHLVGDVVRIGDLACLANRLQGGFWIAKLAERDRPLGERIGVVEARTGDRRRFHPPSGTGLDGDRIPFDPRHDAFDEVSRRRDRNCAGARLAEQLHLLLRDGAHRIGVEVTGHVLRAGAERSQGRGQQRSSRLRFGFELVEQQPDLVYIRGPAEDSRDAHIEDDPAM